MRRDRSGEQKRRRRVERGAAMSRPARQGPLQPQHLQMGLRAGEEALRDVRMGRVRRQRQEPLRHRNAMLQALHQPER